jgi:hypothetical protein
MHTGFWWGKLRERDHLEDTGTRWEDNINMDLREVGWGCIDWIDLAQDSDRWQALTSAVVNIQV